MDVTLTKNGGFFDKGCPGERLITQDWGLQTSGGLCASQWFGVALSAIAFHVRVILFGLPSRGSYRQSRTL